MKHQTSKRINEMSGSCLGVTLRQVAHEIATGAESLSALQWTISTLLEKLHHPDLAAEVQMLQDIDRLHQTYLDLAAMIEVSAALTQDLQTDETDMKRVMKLDSLKNRIFGVGDNSNESGEDEITWF